MSRVTLEQLHIPPEHPPSGLGSQAEFEPFEARSAAHCCASTDHPKYYRQAAQRYLNGRITLQPCVICQLLSMSRVNKRAVTLAQLKSESLNDCTAALRSGGMCLCISYK